MRPLLVRALLIRPSPPLVLLAHRVDPHMNSFVPLMMHPPQNSRHPDLSPEHSRRAEWRDSRILSLPLLLPVLLFVAQGSAVVLVLFNTGKNPGCPILAAVLSPQGGKPRTPASEIFTKILSSPQTHKTRSIPANESDTLAPLHLLSFE